MQAAISDIPAVVVHLWEAGIAQDLDEHLTLCAQEYLGTRFLRYPAGRCKHWLKQQRYPQGPQALSIRAGIVVGSISIGELQLGRGGAGDGHCSDESSDFGSEHGDDAYPCIQVCLSMFDTP